MRDGNFRVRRKETSRVERLSDALFGLAIGGPATRGQGGRVRALRVLLALSAFAAACGKSSAPPPKRDSAVTPAATAVAAAGVSKCPATGQWAECSVLYRLERAGLAPRVDSTAAPAEKSLTGTPLVVKIGLTATLEVHVYADSTARAADVKKLDRTQFIAPGAQQTIKRERLLIENANLIALLTSINEHQRERVADALLAGPPQPSTP